MINTIYVCKFEGNSLLNGDFNFKDEALEWAEEHIEDRPVVEAVELKYDEFGNPTVLEKEEIFHYPVEDVNNDEIDLDIDHMEAEWNDIAEDLEEEEKIEVNSPVEEEQIIFFDPFGCDFSECEPMEVCADEHRADCYTDFNVNAVDFFKELAAELGLEDEVEISEKECADDSCEEKPEVPCDNCDSKISETSDEVKVEEPVTVEDEVKVDVAPEAEVAAEQEEVVPEEVKANEEPNVEVQDDSDFGEGSAIKLVVGENPEDIKIIEDEKPAEKISKCHVCPEWGKEICEYDKQKLTEEDKELTKYVQKQMSDGKSIEEIVDSEEFKELARKEGFKDLEEGFTNEEREEFFKLCNEIGIKTGEDLLRFKKEFPDKDILQSLRNYKAELGDDFKLDELFDLKIDAHNLGGNNNDVSVLSPGKLLGSDVDEGLLPDLNLPGLPNINLPGISEEVEDDMSDEELAEKFYKAVSEKKDLKESVADYKFKVFEVFDYSFNNYSDGNYLNIGIEVEGHPGAYIDVEDNDVSVEFDGEKEIESRIVGYNYKTDNTIEQQDFAPTFKAFAGNPVISYKDDDANDISEDNFYTIIGVTEEDRDGFKKNLNNFIDAEISRIGTDCSEDSEDLIDSYRAATEDDRWYDED